MSLRLILLLPILISACSNRLPVPNAASSRNLTESWQRVLDTHVDEAGRVDFEGAGRDRQELDAVLVSLAEQAEASLDSAEELARLLNGYNAQCLRAVLDSGYEPGQKLRFFWLTEQRLDGSWISLYDFENERLRTLQDARIHFAINCMTRGCPPLSGEAFAGPRLDEQLDAMTRAFASDPRFVQPDADKREVRLSQVLDWYEEDFLAEAPSVLEWLNLYRDEPLDATWKVRWLDYDWTLNHSPDQP